MTDVKETLDLIRRIKENIAKVIVGKERAVELVLCALICGGHVLIEDAPGLGKTTLVSALARSLSCSFKRIQFTPDVLPSDVTGFTSFNLKTGENAVQPA
jgi:MoxR-like ATPase